MVGVSMILSLACAFLLALTPEVTIKFFGSVFHGIDISSIQAPVTLSGVVTGLVAIIIITFVSGWLFTIIYNRLSKIAA